MKQFITTLTLLVGLLVPVVAVAAGDSLEALVLEAVRNNAEIQATRQEVRGLMAASDYAAALPNPNLGVGLLNVPVDGFSLAQEPMTQKQLSVGQRFPWPGKRGLAAESRVLSAQKAEARMVEQALLLQREVAEAYHDLWFVTESLRLNVALSGLVAQATKASASRYGAGREMQQAVLAGELELSRLTDENRDLESRHRMLETRINGLLQRESFHRVVPLSPGEAPMVRPSGAWMALAAGEGNPRLAMLARGVALSRVSLSLAEKEAMPDVEIRVAYSQRDADKNGNARDDFLSLSASVPIPLWKHSREDRLIASMRAQERAALLADQGYRRALPHRIEGLETDLAAAVDRHAYYRKTLVPKARQLSSASLSRYEVGSATFSGMVGDLMTAMKTELMEKKLLRDALVAEARLKELAGELEPGLGEVLKDGETE